jgi:hypothetical protein
MNINRNNYEEYFLLYADNELTQTEKKVVEIFLQENVDLKEEFLMIQMTVNSPEKEMKLSDKSFLLKTEPAFINENNYEQIFVLYHDNELSEEQKRETEKFIAENARFKNDFELIGKAKLESDNSIIYPNKKGLYRKEKSGKVIPLIFWRPLAAAVFVGFGLWAAVSYFNKNEVHQPVASTINHAIKNPEIKDAKPKLVVKEHSENKGENIASSTKNKQPEKLVEDESENKSSIATEEKINKGSTAKTETKVAPAEEKAKIINPEINLQLASNEPIKELPETIEKTANSFVSNTAVKQQNEVADISRPNYAHTASYISDADEKNENYVFYDISTEEFRKSKVGGFLKKVKRIVERTNPIARLLGDEEQLAAK